MSLAHLPKSVSIAILAIVMVASGSVMSVAGVEAADAPAPSEASSARLLGYLWADGSYDDGVWDALGPSGSSTLIEQLVIDHGGTFVDRKKLTFRLPAQYPWHGWKHGLPDDDARTRAVVEDPNFLAAVVEGEGSRSGLIYDQSACCTPGFTKGRLDDLRDLLRDAGFSSAKKTTWNDPDSGRITIEPREYDELRTHSVFVCPEQGSAIRVAGGEDYDEYGPIEWIDSDHVWGELVRSDCRPGSDIGAVGPQSGTCTARVRNGDKVELTWTFGRGDISVRRDGDFQEQVSVLESKWTERPGVGRFSYSIRAVADGLKVSAWCGTVDVGDGTPDPPPAPDADAFCRGRAVTISGTSGDDFIDGTSGSDVIDAGAGDDVIRGFGGDDVICGRSGDDRLIGGSGDDVLAGGGGDDVLYGAEGRDKLIGKSGFDYCDGGPSADEFDETCEDDDR